MAHDSYGNFIYFLLVLFGTCGDVEVLSRIYQCAPCLVLVVVMCGSVSTTLVMCAIYCLWCGCQAFYTQCRWHSQCLPLYSWVCSLGRFCSPKGYGVERVCGTYLFVAKGFEFKSCYSDYGFASEYTNRL